MIGRWGKRLQALGQTKVFGMDTTVCRSPITTPITPAVAYHSHDFDFEEVISAGETFLAKAATACKSEDTAESAASLAYKQWQKFHFLHEGKFFHPRLYATEAFPELLCSSPDLLDSTTSTAAGGSRGLRIFEIGCGNGSNVFPILRKNPSCTVYCTDFVPAALKTIVTNSEFDSVRDRCHVFLWDILGHTAFKPAPKLESSEDDTVTSGVSDVDWSIEPAGLAGSMNIVIVMFVLSALHPKWHERAFVRAAETLLPTIPSMQLLRPGGILAFRDYGMFDAAMLRASDGNILSEKLHVRGDGTLSYYFELEEVRRLAFFAGLDVLELEYCTVRNVNRKKGVEMKRVWVHGKFRKR